MVIRRQRRNRSWSKLELGAALFYGVVAACYAFGLDAQQQERTANLLAPSLQSAVIHSGAARRHHHEK